jgi:hypothetical protein
VIVTNLAVSANSHDFTERLFYLANDVPKSLPL